MVGCKLKKPEADKMMAFQISESLFCHDKKWRKEALAQFENVGWPTRKLEHWKYSALDRRLGATPLKQAISGEHSEEQKALQQGLTLNFNAGELITDLGALKLPKGLRIRRLRDLPEAELDAILATDFEAKRHPLAHLNTALLSDGVYIEVADHTQIAEPLKLFYQSASEPNSMSALRQIVRVGCGSQLTLIEDSFCFGTPAWLNTLMQVSCEDNAQVKHYVLSREHCLQHVQNLQVKQSANSHFLQFTLGLGAAFKRLDLDVDLLGEGAHCESRGAYCLNQATHFDVHSQMRHLASNTRSDVFYKGLIDDQARAVFNTKAIAAKGMKGIVAHQNNRNLLLSSQAEVDTKPELEIYTDDVECTHGATVGQLDEQAIFYCQSRGIDADDAREMLTRSFLFEVCETIDDQDVQKTFQSNLETCIAQHFEGKE